MDFLFQRKSLPRRLCWPQLEILLLPLPPLCCCVHYHIQLHTSGSFWDSMNWTKRSLEEPTGKGSPTRCRQPNQFPGRQGSPLGINPKRIFIKSFSGLSPKQSSKVVPPVRVWPFNVPLSKTHSATLPGSVTVLSAFTGELIFSVLSLVGSWREIRRSAYAKGKAEVQGPVIRINQFNAWLVYPTENITYDASIDPLRIQLLYLGFWGLWN